MLIYPYFNLLIAKRTFFYRHVIFHRTNLFQQLRLPAFDIVVMESPLKYQCMSNLSHFHENNFAIIASRYFGAKLIMHLIYCTTAPLKANFMYHEFLSTQSAMNFAFALHIQLMMELLNDFLIVSFALNAKCTFEI